jgi:feruloyl-CoA synthase
MASPQREVRSERRVRPVRLGAPEVIVDRRDDGTILLRSPHALPAYPDRLTDRLAHWARIAPERVLMADRNADGHWRRVTYAQALNKVRRIAAALLRRDLSAERPIAILSGNDLEHALLGLAANYIGVPYAPVSPAYSLISSDFGKLRHIVNLLTPGLVFACNGGQYARALQAVVPPDVEVVVTRNQLANRPMTLFSELDAAPTALDDAHAKVGPDTIAKFLFTSGSTGMPKGVINTQRMWCSNQVMIGSALQFFSDEPPVIVDWAPWHHTAGGNHDVGIVIHNGGTMYIDQGKPLPGAIEETVKNLREIAPTWYFTVPKGYEALLPFFRADASLRENFFSRLKVLWFAGAGIAQHVFEEWKEMAHRTCGEDILFLTGLGSTETAPYAFGRMWNAANAMNIGLPPPGVAVKLVPLGQDGQQEGKYEARLKGPSITPGYWRDVKLTADAYDEEGFYRLGDALKFDDAAAPEKGLVFDGRIAEDFKLATGTWVGVGPLRAAFIAHCAPYVKDVVIAGADRDFIAALIFPDLDACRRLAPDLPSDAGAAAIVANEGVRREFRFLLNSLAKASTGSSNRVARALLLDTPPSLDVGEATDKGSINQRMVLRHRAALVDELYAGAPSPRVMAIDER